MKRNAWYNADIRTSKRVTFPSYEPLNPFVMDSLQTCMPAIQKCNRRQKPQETRNMINLRLPDDPVVAAAEHGHGHGHGELVKSCMYASPP